MDESIARSSKRSICRQIVTGAKRPAQICPEHNFSASLLRRLRKEYRARGEEAFTPDPVTEIERLHGKVAELERFVGQLAWENTLLKKGLSSVPSKNGRMMELGRTEHPEHRFGCFVGGRM